MRASQLAVILAAALSAPAQAANGEAERGRALYMKNMCYSCHGTAAQGGERGSGPSLAPNPFPWKDFQRQVRHPRESMPRYGAQYLSDADLADIYAYVASIKPGRPAKEIPLLKE